MHSSLSHVLAATCLPSPTKHVFFIWLSSHLQHHSDLPLSHTIIFFILHFLSSSLICGISWTLLSSFLTFSSSPSCSTLPPPFFCVFRQPSGGRWRRTTELAAVQTYELSFNLCEPLLSESYSFLLTRVSFERDRFLFRDCRIVKSLQMKIYCVFWSCFMF